MSPGGRPLAHGQQWLRLLRQATIGRNTPTQEELNDAVSEKSLFQQPVSRRQVIRLAVQGGTVIAMGSMLGGVLAGCGTKAPASGGTGAPASGGAAAPQTATVKWVSPRGTLEVVDDFQQTIAMKMGYFKDLGIDAQFEPGPLEATATTKLVVTHQSDFGFPSPGVFSLALEAGMPIVSIWNQGARDVFGYSVVPNSPIQKITDLKGKKIALGDAGWQAISDPILKIAGLDPKSVEYVPAGAQWAQTVAEGKADAALNWQGLTAQWEGAGIKLRHMYALNFSPFPANTYVIHQDDLKDAKKADVLKRFLKAMSMGMTWGYANPRGAVQLSYERFPALKGQMPADIGTKSLLQLQQVFTSPETEKNGWGWHRMDGWTAYFKTLKDMGQITKAIKAEDVCKNDWIAEVNNFDKAKVKKDAADFKLAPEFEKIDPSKIQL